MAAASPTSFQPHLRSLYRSLLRELPPRPASSSLSLYRRSPLHQRIRASFAASSQTSTSMKPTKPSTTPLRQIQEAEQFLRYVRSQRMYATLLERYNPGMNMDEEERVRLTARRVGMEMPVDVMVRPWGSEGGGQEGGGGGEGTGKA